MVIPLLHRGIQKFYITGNKENGLYQTYLFQFDTKLLRNLGNGGKKIDNTLNINTLDWFAQWGIEEDYSSFNSTGMHFPDPAIMDREKKCSMIGIWQLAAI